MSFYRNEPTFNPDHESDDYERVHCDGCDALIIDGAAENGRLGTMYLCPRCYSEKIAAIQTVDFHDEVRR